MILSSITAVKPDQRGIVILCGVFCALIAATITAYMIYAWKRREIWLINRWSARTVSRDASPFWYWFIMLFYFALDILSVKATITVIERLSL
jgi:predicted membrane-bound dolichyl-phosphate-mannose-protein mannosyltransferase